MSLSPFTPEAAAALPGPDWLRARRTAAAERFAAMALPTEAEEIWRYSRVSLLDLGRYAPAPAPAPAGLPGLPGGLDALVAAVGPPAAVVVVRNGRITNLDVDPDLAGRGLVVADVVDLPDGDDRLGEVASPAADAFGELNAAFLPGAVVVEVPAGLVVDRPILVLHVTEGEGTASLPRTIVHLGPNAEATVIEHHSSSDVAAYVDPVVELSVGDGARLGYLAVQDLGPRVWQTAYQASRVGRDATLRSAVVALGGDYARVLTDSRIEGGGGTSDLTALYLADGARMHDFRTLQDHAAPNSTSNLLFKGAVTGQARAVYSGLIRVRKGAPGTNAYQTNRNLVLSAGAGAMSVPNLEIENNDVRCSHATAVGPIDDDHRYYLESRGVPPEVAERLIVLGFFGEVLDRLPAPALVPPLRQTLADRLGSR